MQEEALIVFIKNPRLGKVKTRLASAIGDKNALKIFEKLLLRTLEITKDVNADKYLFYSDFIDENDIWPNDIFKKKLQNSSPDLGQRMFSAFEDIKHLGYKKAIIIGSDIFENTTTIINTGFSFLKDSEAIIGKAHDGGYYSIGFNFGKIDSEQFLKNIFLDRTWSHDQVANEALKIIEEFSYSCNFLPTLSDIDTEKDLRKFPDLYNNV